MPAPPGLCYVVTVTYAGALSSGHMKIAFGRPPTAEEFLAAALRVAEMDPADDPANDDSLIEGVTRALRDVGMPETPAVLRVTERAGPHGSVCVCSNAFVAAPEAL
jgi:hypothetical protein